tara:strand:+ start:456 stop:992 length:537 start_codon:yes stop_codon:yes gene_type:complete
MRKMYELRGEICDGANGADDTDPNIRFDARLSKKGRVYIVLLIRGIGREWPTGSDRNKAESFVDIQRVWWWQSKVGARSDAGKELATFLKNFENIGVPKKKKKAPEETVSTGFEPDYELVTEAGLDLFVSLCDSGLAATSAWKMALKKHAVAKAEAKKDDAKKPRRRRTKAEKPTAAS